jgi:hypothetical protein
MTTYIKRTFECDYCGNRYSRKEDAPRWLTIVERSQNGERLSSFDMCSEPCWRELLQLAAKQDVPDELPVKRRKKGVAA